MNAVMEFLQTPYIAFIGAASLCIAFFLIAKKRPKWVISALFILAIGLVANYRDFFLRLFPAEQQATYSQSDTPANFQSQLLQAIEDLKLEAEIEKANLNRIMDQVQEIFKEVDTQKQKLQQFIEETHERLTTDITLAPTEEQQPTHAAPSEN